MKKLLVLTALIGTVILSGCTDKKEVKQEVLFEPKFTLNQEVTVHKGFLKGQTGKIINCNRCKADGQGTYESDVVCYDILFKIDGEDKIWSNISERELEF